MKGLSRVDNDTKHGWLCRVYGVDGKSVLSKWFGDKTHNGPDNAKKDATKWLNATHKKAAKQRQRAKQTARPIKQENATTDKIGLSLCTARGKYHFYMTSWYNATGRKNTKTFYVGTIGKYTDEHRQAVYEEATQYLDAVKKV